VVVTGENDAPRIWIKGRKKLAQFYFIKSWTEPRGRFIQTRGSSVGGRNFFVWVTSNLSTVGESFLLCGKGSG